MTVNANGVAIFVLTLLLLGSPPAASKHASAFVKTQWTASTCKVASNLSTSFRWKTRTPILHDAEYKEYGSNIKVLTPVEDDIPVKASMYAPNGDVAEAFAWTIPKGTYLHPELHSDFPVGQWLPKKANVGIALSGGGMRAASCTLGW